MISDEAIDFRDLLLRRGVNAWNAWRRDHPDIRPNLFRQNLRETNLAGVDFSWAGLTSANFWRANLRGANLQRASLSGADLAQADLSGANLSGAFLKGATLFEANLSGANLAQADLSGVQLGGANLRSANLTRAELVNAQLFGADLSGATLVEALIWGARLDHANLTEANLRKANLMSTTLVETDLSGTDLTNCRIYGLAAWDVKLNERTKQQNLIITKTGVPEVTVDNIDVAQFVYLLLHNENIRNVIDTIGKKGVLLLGRFTEGRMEILIRLQEKLRDLGFIPMVFNFDKPETKDFTETIRVLTGLSRFVIVDITNPRSTPLELQATVPDYMVPFVPILQAGEQPFAMFVDLQIKYDWVLDPVLGYSSIDRLIEVVEEKIVQRAETKFNELLARRTKQLQVENA